MWKLIRNIMYLAIAVVFILVLHLSTAYLLPYPWDKVNIIFAVVLLVLIFFESGLVVWLSFLVHGMLELYSTTPFGITLISGTVSILFAYWTYKRILTNASWYSFIMLSFVALSFYRIIYIALLIPTHIFQYGALPAVGRITVVWGWELLFTTILVLLGYIALKPWNKKQQPIRYYKPMHK